MSSALASARKRRTNEPSPPPPPPNQFPPNQFTRPIRQQPQYQPQSQYGGTPYYPQPPPQPQPQPPREEAPLLTLPQVVEVVDKRLTALEKAGPSSSVDVTELQTNHELLAGEIEKLQDEQTDLKNTVIKLQGHILDLNKKVDSLQRAGEH